MDIEQIQKVTRYLRYLILKSTHKTGSGHPTSSFSAVELSAVLYFRHLKYDLDHPEAPYNDRVIFSKGHASALMYSLYVVAGKLTEEEITTYRDFGSPLEGHPTKRFLYAEAATGSLGQGLSIGAGEAFALKKLYGTEPDHPHVYVLLGDGELAEGSVWEAVAWASHRSLSNVIAVADVNRLGQSEATMYGHDTGAIGKRFEAFGWKSIEIDGHDLDAIDNAFNDARASSGKPTVILAKTKKGKGIGIWEDKDGWHNKMLPEEELKSALDTFKTEPAPTGIIQKPDKKVYDVGTKNPETEVQTSYFLDQKSVSYSPADYIPTKKAFGNALVRLGSLVPNLIVLDGDVSNSLHTDAFRDAYPDRFLQMYIAEQNMLGVATGLARRGMLPFVATFACFLSRAADQIRMLHLTGSTVLIHGSYVGVSVGRDGPSQMGLSDIAQFRSLPDSIVLYPSDPYATEYLVGQMVHQRGAVYLRTTREGTPVIYTGSDEFPIGGSRVFPAAKKDTSSHVTILAAGITLHESRKAQKILEDLGISVTVVDCYSVKPLDVETVRRLAGESEAFVVVEDHYPEGGLGEAVLSAVADIRIPVHHLAVRKVPMSGSPSELLRYVGIDAESIRTLILKIVGT